MSNSYILVEWPESQSWLNKVYGDNRDVLSVEFSDNIINPAVMVKRILFDIDTTEEE